MYKGYVLSKNVYGYFTCFISNHGYLKADTLQGLKKLINEVIEEENQ